MSAFDKIIGYETIKSELLQICDMIHNRKIYDDLGAKLPQGILLYGNPGLGKTLMAKCFIEESGLQAFTVRRNKGSDDFIGEITDTFARAKEHAPAIVFLDDMDKFANEDDHHRNAEEYVAVQSGIDEIKNCDVFVIATVNEKRSLPDSLTRAGRFDRRYELDCPTGKDAADIIAHYLKDKKVSDSVNMEDLTKMISYSSCAELETILNEAAIKAAYARKETVEMEDLVQAVLGMQYDCPDNYTKTSAEKLKKTALHEAGHLVVSEVLASGSVGLASLRTTGRDKTGGFIHRCKELSRDSDHVLVCLGGKAAVELYYTEECADGCESDIDRALRYIRHDLSVSASRGFGLADVATRHYDISEVMNSRSEAVVQAELERCFMKTKDILLKNRAFLEKAAEALMEKETLLYSDICEIKKDVDIIYMQY
ncbi:MAG: AAA family ATPase [Lachnospiraceae bacterium]|nr:AAA family ATPase [Lachnospiraceae bacterium]